MKRRSSNSSKDTRTTGIKCGCILDGNSPIPPMTITGSREKSLKESYTKILHDFRKIAEALKYCEHDCFLVELFDNLYKDVNAIFNSNNK